jgi:chaperonin cofactor prefoldin|tara:strand:- start:1031 stop:1264 length:234 start_codon:yes stop_codon:yes gene_type:complete
MANIEDMAKAHLQNVQQQIQDLEARKNQIDIDIEQLKSYLEQGVSELQGVADNARGVVAERPVSSLDMSNPAGSIFK